jgi:hypothetical protein
MRIDSLSLLGFRTFQAYRAARTFRRHDEETLRELAGMRHDIKKYLTVARQRIQDLEEILRQEFAVKTQTDVGWDTESLREDYATS